MKQIRKILLINRKANNIVFAVLLIGLMGAIFYKVAYIRSVFVCGKIIGISKIKGVSYVNYSFIVNGKKYFESVANHDLKRELIMDSLKKIQCVQIEYSFISPAINRFSDKRFLVKE